MLKLTAFKALAILFISSMALVSCNNDDNSTPQPQEKTIAEIVAETPRFSILLEAVQKTGLESILNGSDQLTVFAPNNDAFAQLLQDQGISGGVDGLIDALGEDAVRNILLYHVLGGEVKAADVPTGFVTTNGVYDGQSDEFLALYLNTASGVVANGVSTVITPDIDASNGVIHEIDVVLLPMNVLQIAQVDAGFSSLVSAVLAAEDDVVNRLGSETDVTTVFAPTNAAFADLLDRAGVASLDELVDAIGQDGLTSVLLYHTVNGNVRSGDLMNGNVTTLQGTDITINLDGDNPTITDGNGDVANIVATDVQGTNGVVHVIDFVIQPAP
ncbi:MAG TPA: fasciclin [Flavobacteriales bacterium]|jgi:transforming growth factor-beta-induced protein|nr:fasciclin [Flavobacteriales bacterium]